MKVGVICGMQHQHSITKPSTSVIDELVQTWLFLREPVTFKVQTL